MIVSSAMAYSTGNRHALTRIGCRAAGIRPLVAVALRVDIAMMSSPRGFRPLKRHFIIALDVLLLVVVLGLLVRRALPQATAALGLAGGSEPAPLFTLESLAGDSVSLASLRGQVVLVNFWASWCAPCRVEMPGFERVYRERSDEGFVIVGIATDRHAEARIREFIAEHDITYPILLGTAEVIGVYGGVSALPESFLIDRDGRIRHRVIGYFAEPALRAAVSRMLGDEPS